MTKKLRHIAVTAIGLAAAGSLLAAPNAAADPTADTGAVINRKITGQAHRERVTDYWTAERMRAATPRSVDVDQSVTRRPVAAGTPDVVRGTAPARSARGKVPTAEGVPTIGGPWTGGGAVTGTTGKVFFTLSGSDYVCSASVVPATNQNTVATAGHCVNDGAGSFATNFVFVPGYDNGATPYGEWSATSLGTTSQWDSSEDFNYDVGFAVVSSADGSALTDAVGSQSIGFNQPRGEFLYSFGYPAAAPYDGEELDYCSDDATDDANGTDDQRLDCNLTGGSSGGPWLADFSEADGTGVQVSVNSFGYTNEPDAMYGPYFGSVIEDLYNEVQVS